MGKFFFVVLCGIGLGCGGGTGSEGTPPGSTPTPSPTPTPPPTYMHPTVLFTSARFCFDPDTESLRACLIDPSLNIYTPNVSFYLTELKPDGVTIADECKTRLESDLEVHPPEWTAFDIQQEGYDFFLTGQVIAAGQNSVTTECTGKLDPTIWGIDLQETFSKRNWFAGITVVPTAATLSAMYQGNTSTWLTEYEPFIGGGGIVIQDPETGLGPLFAEGMYTDVFATTPGGVVDKSTKVLRNKWAGDFQVSSYQYLTMAYFASPVASEMDLAGWFH